MTIAIGDVFVYQIVGNERILMAPSALFPTADPSVLAAALATADPRDIDPASGQIAIAVSGYFIVAGERRILVDTGSSDPEGAARFRAALAAAGCEPDDVDTVLCTHIHGDRVGGNVRLSAGAPVPAFSRARYVVSRAEFDHHALRHAAGLPVPPYFMECVLPLKDQGRLDLVATDSVLVDQSRCRIRLEPAIGHTAGHVLVRIESRGAVGVIAGDVAHHPLQIAHPEMRAPNEFDAAAAEAARRSLIDGCAGTDTVVMPAHFRPPSAGLIVKTQHGHAFARL